MGSDYNIVSAFPDLEKCIHTIGGTPKYSKGFCRFPLPDLAGGTFVSATLLYNIYPLNPGTLGIDVFTLTQSWDGTEGAATMDGWSLGSAFASYTVQGNSIIPKSHDVTDFIAGLYALAEGYASFAFEAPSITGTPSQTSGGITLGWEQTVENDKEIHDLELVITYQAAAGGIFAFYSGAFN